MGRELEVGGTQRSGNIGAGARGISCACAGVEPLRAGTACAPKVSRAARISPGARLCARRTNRSTLAAGDASESYGCLRGFGAAAAGPRRTQPRSLGCGCAARQYNSAKSSCAGRIQPLPWPSATDQRIVADAWLCVPEGLRRKLAGGKPAPRARPPVVPPNGPCPSGASKKFLATVSRSIFFIPRRLVPLRSVSHSLAGKSNSGDGGGHSLIGLPAGASQFLVRCLASAPAGWGRHPCLPVGGASLPRVLSFAGVLGHGNGRQGCRPSWQARMPAPPRPCACGASFLEHGTRACRRLQETEMRPLPARRRQCYRGFRARRYGGGGPVDRLP